MLTILHTSDWHLGHKLYGRERYEEFSAFLRWLEEQICQHEVDILLIAGDIFDTSDPRHKAQELYYEFLSRVSRSCCRHVVIIAGNHDSPSFINVPKALLSAFRIHVVGQACEDLAEELIELRDDAGKVEALIAAVPYLRAGELRRMKAGESMEDKNLQLIEGLRAHYEGVAQLGAKRQAELADEQGGTVPLLAMGHLFAAGGQTVEDDGVRDFAVGNLLQISGANFPSELDYVALGHLHIPQVVGGFEHIRYSGSPLPMGFGEAKQQKKYLLLRYEDGLRQSIESHDIPCFQKLLKLTGRIADITAELEVLKAAGESVWVEIEYSEPELVSNLREGLHELVTESCVEILRIHDAAARERLLKQLAQLDDFTELKELDSSDVFKQVLDTHQVPSEQRDELQACYAEILQELSESDSKSH